MKRFSKLNMPKMGKRPMMMALTALIIIFLFWFFFMRGSRSEGFREGNAASKRAKFARHLASGKIQPTNQKQQQIKQQELDRIAKEKAEKAAKKAEKAAKEVKAPKKTGKK